MSAVSVVAVASPRITSRSSSLRRVGSAIASQSSSSSLVAHDVDALPGREEVSQPVSLALPAVGVVVDELLLVGVGPVELVEPGLDHAQAGSRVAVGGERERHERRVVVRCTGAGRIAPTERESVRTIGGDDRDADNVRVSPSRRGT